MKKVLFIDEKKYRFSHYYENKNWWLKNGVTPTFKDYEKKNNKYEIYGSLLFNRPDYIVIVQLSTKNFILLQLANLLRIKVIFWQHGIFEYPIYINKKLKILPMKLHKLLGLSAFDLKGISNLFAEINSSSIIKHYDLAKLDLTSKKDKDGFLNIAYLAQIVTKQQVFGSNAKVMEQYLGEFDLFKQILEKIESQNLRIRILAKKHPGDKSDYLKDLAKQYTCLELTDIEELLQCDVAISYYSTLMLAFLELNKGVIQLPMANGNFRIDMQHYDNNNKLFRINTTDDFFACLPRFSGCNEERLDYKFVPISETIFKVINDDT